MRNTLYIFLILLCSSCDRHGFKYRIFAVDETTLLNAIDSLYILRPQYKAPARWTVFDGFSYMRKVHNTSERRFYFPSPDEMYYVTMAPYEGETKMIISAVHTDTGWHAAKDLTSDEIERIEKRFDDKVISKLEDMTNSKCTIDD